MPKDFVILVILQCIMNKTSLIKKIPSKKLYSNSLNKSVNNASSWTRIACPTCLTINYLACLLFCVHPVEPNNWLPYMLFSSSICHFFPFFLVKPVVEPDWCKIDVKSAKTQDEKDPNLQHYSPANMMTRFWENKFNVTHWRILLQNNKPLKSSKMLTRISNGNLFVIEITSFKIF